MKHKTHHLYYLLYQRSWIIILLLFSTIAISQESPAQQDKFYIGAEFHNQTIENTIFYDPFDTSGMNTISQRADIMSTWSHIKDYNILAANVQNKTDWIAHYTTCYYSKWEAEQNLTGEDTARVGFKHKGGEIAFWDSAWCWSTSGLAESKNSIVYGPHYRQDKRYKRWLYDTCYNQPGCLSYTPRFRMALDNHGGAGSNEDVCIIKVVFSYRYENTYPQSTTFIQRTLKVGDFDSTGEFNDFYLHPEPGLGIYEYPPEFILPMKFLLAEGIPSPVGYIDCESYTGIQYCIDWLRDDNLCTLYIDYVEVYDNNGWNDYIDRPVQTAKLITDYADSFKTSDWQNIKYWLGVDEPYSIDCYTPIRVVDSLIQTVNPNAPLIVPFNPTWWHTLDVNGEDEVSMFYNIAKPKRITLSNNPCLADYPTIRYEDFEFLRFNLQRTSALDSNFWFNVQAEGYRTNYNEPNEDPEWCIWRKPQPAELRAMVMLASAHGAKGIFFKWFDSYISGESYCGTTLKDAIVSRTAEGTELYFEIKDNLAPRFTGSLGNTLKDLDYTGDYINLYCNGCPNHDRPSIGYLTLDCEATNFHWHCGFFNHKTFADNKYFLLTNLRTTQEVTAILSILNNTGYKNLRFANVEGGIDTTIGYNASMPYYDSVPAGEGRLYQVASVVKYGGRLLYPESIQPGMTLEDDMVIESGAILTINGTYTSKGNITVKNGGIINGSNGKIQFVDGKKLIIEGSGSITGTTGSKLQLVFSESQNDDPIGIMIKSNSSLTITNCKIDGATTGINSQLNANYLCAQFVDLINCKDYSICIAGHSPGENPTPVPRILSCTITNSDYGIHISNHSEIIIRGNIISNTDCGIYLSSVTGAQVIDNQIQTSTAVLQALFANSTTGVIRGNIISGHTVGLYFANSSMDVGGNFITECLYHGMYIGDGSVPNMVGRLVQDIGHHYYYATSGYNKIYANGGYEGPGDDNDGSEIYFNGEQANAIMDKGCNSIFDDRESSPPLINTELLMNCPFGQEITVSALHNYWGETEVIERRFGNMSVDFGDALSDSCHLPDGREGEDELIVKSSSGEVIDTVYSIGEEVTNLSPIESTYSEAEEKFLTGDMASALQLYDGIIAGGATEEEKYMAYERKYEIGRITGQSPEYFNELGTTFTALASNAQDSVSRKILNHHSILCKVGEQQYEESIGDFDAIIQQNPSTEEAVYAEIDALTTALLIEESDSTLQKGRLGKYLVKTSGDYNQRIDEILRKNFGSGSKENQKEIIPTEYTLYQNYPNPFNPVTTIKYDLPNTSDVSLIIYDILGRKVKELVNTKQQTGRYEVQFNASQLASGVYIYQLIADKFIQSRKMILLK